MTVTLKEYRSVPEIKEKREKKPEVAKTGAVEGIKAAVSKTVASLDPGKTEGNQAAGTFEKILVKINDAAKEMIFS